MTVRTLLAQPTNTATARNANVFRTQLKILDDLQLSVPAEKKAVIAVHDLLRKKIACGATIEQIRSAFNPTEQLVFDKYIMAENPISISEVVALLDISYSTITASVKNINEILNGRGRNQRFFEKYERLTTEELRAAVIETGTTTREGLREYDHCLASVAYRRGILDELIPKKIPSNLLVVKIRKAYDKLKETKAPEEILAMLKPVEASFIKLIALSPDPVSDEMFIELHKLAKTGLPLIKRKILLKLSGEEVVERELMQKFNRLKEICRGTDKKTIETWKKDMKPEERTILECRILAKKPSSLRELAGILGKTFERARQIEAELLGKMERWNRGETVPRRKPGKAITRLNALIEKKETEGIPLKSIERILSENEKAILREYILAKGSASLKEVAESVGIPSTSISCCVTFIEVKIVRIFGQ